MAPIPVGALPTTGNYGYPFEPDWQRIGGITGALAGLALLFGGLGLRGRKGIFDDDEEDNPDRIFTERQLKKKKKEVNK